MTLMKEHDLGECEGLYGYSCDVCQDWYRDQADDWQQEEYITHDAKREGSEP